MEDLLSKYALERPETPAPVILIGDFLRDLDDEHTLLAAVELERAGFIRLLCVVANTTPALVRARGAKGTLQQLGRGDVPVGVGCAVCDVRVEDYESQVPYLAPEADVELDGAALLARTLEACPEPKSVVLVLQSGLTDAANLLRSHEELFEQKIKLVAVMGGLLLSPPPPLIEGHVEFAQPNSAANNAFDMASAEHVVTMCQELRVPLLVTTRDAVTQVQVPFAFVDALAATGSPVGLSLLARQQPSILALWRKACAAPGSDERETLPADRDRAWFVGNFCRDKRDPPIPDGSDAVWGFLDSFNLYDAVNLLASVDALRARFFAPKRFGHGDMHQIIGFSKQEHGVADAAGLADFMLHIELLALQK